MIEEAPSSPGLIDHFRPDPFRPKDEFNGLSNCAVPSKRLGGVVRDFLYFWHGVANGDRQPRTPHQRNVRQIVSNEGHFVI